MESLVLARRFPCLGAAEPLPLCLSLKEKSPPGPYSFRCACILIPVRLSVPMPVPGVALPSLYSLEDLDAHRQSLGWRDPPPAPWLLDEAKPKTGSVEIDLPQRWCVAHAMSLLGAPLSGVMPSTACSCLQPGNVVFLCLFIHAIQG